MRVSSIVVGIAAGTLLVGCGVTEEQLAEKLGAERRFAAQERKQFVDHANGRLDAMEARLADTIDRLQRAQQDLARDVAAFSQRVAHVESDLGTIKTVAVALEQLRNDSEGRLSEMKQLHEAFNANVETLDKRIAISQEKYREIIRKNIQSLKEQYQYFSNLLRELEQGGGGD